MKDFCVQLTPFDSVLILDVNRKPFRIKITRKQAEALISLYNLRDDNGAGFHW